MNLPDLELAALSHSWEAWARPKQLAPVTPWRSWGYIAGRGFGKTRSVAEFVVGEVIAGRATRIGFCSFNLDEAERTLIHGVSGLLAVSPPWFPGKVVKGQVVWPNGAIATPFTPEVPDGPRGPEHDLFWCSEVAAFPVATRDEFFKNVREGLRLGLGRMVFDTTPRARNPLVRYLLERSKRDPARHIVIGGATRENADNLTAGFVAELEVDYGGTQRAKQELEGVFFDDAEGALWQQKWIDDHRRDVPTQTKRRILSVDPAISTKKGTDATGIVEMALGPDDQIFVLADLTDRLSADAWGALVIERYVRGGCDCVVVETNRGAELVFANLKACGERRGVRVERVERDAKTRRDAGTVYVKETFARSGKAERAGPVASLYERGRVSHARGADLSELEESLCSWDPQGNGESPNALDAMVHGAYELAELHRNAKPDGAAAVRAAAAMQARVSAPTRAPNVAALIGRGGGRGGDCL